LFILSLVWFTENSIQLLIGDCILYNSYSCYYKKFKFSFGTFFNFKFFV